MQFYPRLFKHSKLIYIDNKVDNTHVSKHAFESNEEQFYPSLLESIRNKSVRRINEAAMPVAKQNWLNLYNDNMGQTEFVNPKSFEILRLNFGPNDGTAEDNINKFLQTYAKIDKDAYTIEVIPKKMVDKDVKREISGQFTAYKILFTRNTTDVFKNNYSSGDFLIFTNKSFLDIKSGEAAVIGKKELTPDKLGLPAQSYSNPKALLEKINNYIENHTKYPENYKKFILMSSKLIVDNLDNKSKFNSFYEYTKVTTPIEYKIMPDLFTGIDQTSLNNIQNDYGEVLGAFMFFNILKNPGVGLKYPTASNERLVDFYFDNYKISSKGGKGATPSGDTMINFINNSYKNDELTFDTEHEIEFYENVIEPWTNPEKLDSRSTIYNKLITLASVNLAKNNDSGFSYFIKSSKASTPLISRDVILSFMDNLVDDKEQFESFMSMFIRKTQFSSSKFDMEFYRSDYITKRDTDNGDRIGIILYPIMVELSKYLTKNYADTLTKYAQKVTDIKQVYLDVSIKRGLFSFRTQSFSSAAFEFEQKGSINNPFNANIGIKIKH
jgi:hypothetical protein